MASSEYYEGEVKKERKREIGASYRTKSDIKKKEKALMDKAINLYAKELKEAEDRGVNTSSLKDKARSKHRKTIAQIKKDTKEALKKPENRLKKSRVEQDRDRKTIKEYGKDAGKTRSFMTPSRKGVERSDKEIREAIMKSASSGTPKTAQGTYDAMQNERKASGGAVNKNYAYGGRVAKMSSEKS
tara:strand:- start:118 stop:675 length:558 start_codon:yes stop_codon:yes gene_type:complete